MNFGIAHNVQLHIIGSPEPKSAHNFLYVSLIYVNMHIMLVCSLKFALEH